MKTSHLSPTAWLSESLEGRTWHPLLNWYPSSVGQSQMSRPRGRFARSKARQGDSLRHQIPAPCPHSPPHGIYIDRCIRQVEFRDRLRAFPPQGHSKLSVIMWCPQTCSQIQLWTPFWRPEGFRLRELPLYLTHPCLCFDLQSSQVKRTPPPSPQDSLNEFITRKLNPLVVVDFRFIGAFLHVWWAVNSHARQLRNFYQLSSPEFDENIF